MAKVVIPPIKNYFLRFNCLVYRFVFGFISEGEHKVRPYIGFGHWLDFGIFSRQHFPLTCTYALCNNALFDTEKGVIAGENSLILIEI
jgi:hypothetical protein